MPHNFCSTEDTETQKQLTETNNRYDSLLQKLQVYIDDLNLNKQYIIKDDKVVGHMDWVTNMSVTLQQNKPIAQDIDQLEREISDLEVRSFDH